MDLKYLSLFLFCILLAFQVPPLLATNDSQHSGLNNHLDSELKPLLEHLSKVINAFNLSQLKMDAIIKIQDQSVQLEQQKKRMEALELESERQSFRLNGIENLLSTWFRKPLTQNLQNTKQFYSKPLELNAELLQVAKPTPALIVFETSCLDFDNSSSVHEIQVPGTEPFEVRCDSQLAGNGWIVMQRRFNGIGNFNRNWLSYSDGFGYLDREFFIGLEKLYRLTISKRYELYIHMEYFDNTKQWAHYDNFLIGNETEGYILKSLGNFSGSTENRLIHNLNAKFTTYDMDNDQWLSGNCAVEKHGGWWHKSCTIVNPNGKYYNEERYKINGIHWIGWRNLKAITMLIRPNNETFSGKKFG